MQSPLDRQRSFEFRLRSVLLLVVAGLVLFALSPSLAAAASEEAEGGPPTVEPVIVPEVETPATPPVTVPLPTTATPAPAPSSKPTESSSAPAPVTHTTTHSTHSSGSSSPAPTSVNHSVNGPPSSGSESGGNSGSSSSGSGSSSQPVETSSSSPTSTESATAGDVGKVVSALGALGGHAAAKDKKGRQEVLGHLGSAVGKALLGSQVTVAAPSHKDQGPMFVPLPGKNKLLYFVLILAVMAVAALVVWLQFRGPRESRRWKATIDHRTSARLSPAERARARAHSRRWTTTERTRRKAA
jgi:hypothetical protein